MLTDTLLTKLKTIIDSPAKWSVFEARLRTHSPRLYELLASLYGTREDFEARYADIVCDAARAYMARPRWLRQLDLAREQNPTWFKSNQMLGAVCYVDLYAGNLNGLRERISYFKELGVTYLHLMPLFKAPEPNNDGGYAVSSYREVNPQIGTIRQLATLARELHNEGISLCLDFIFNHTSDEHVWAQQAKDGDPLHRDFYFIFPDRTSPDQYEKNLREIFPDEHPGAFSQQPNGEWVWTTFHSYQWDLNYANPRVFQAMADEMLYIANLGVEVLRMDAVAFIWKQMGTVCENLPEAHTLIQAFNAVCRIAAPSLLFKSEAIVHPDDVNKYISTDECQLSYNPLMMALLWNSLATREVRMLRQALAKRYAIPQDSAWVNYVRCHDDIGWTFSDEDAARLGINGYDHRRFLNQFYTARFEGTFARGVPFQENPKTGDCRISGTAASLAGLERALSLSQSRNTEIELALRRLLLIHSVILSTGGIPLLYLGDETAQLNDYSYLDDPAKHHDSRWVHRPRLVESSTQSSDESREIGEVMRTRLLSLIQLRQQQTAFAGGELHVLNTWSDHILGYSRQHADQRITVFANFSEHAQVVPSAALCEMHLPEVMTDLVSGGDMLTQTDIALQPYQFVWLTY